MNIDDIRRKVLAALAAGVEITVNGSLPIVDARLSHSKRFLVVFDSGRHAHAVWPGSPSYVALVSKLG